MLRVFPGIRLVFVSLLVVVSDSQKKGHARCTGGKSDGAMSHKCVVCRPRMAAGRAREEFKTSMSGRAEKNHPEYQQYHAARDGAGGLEA